MRRRPVRASADSSGRPVGSCCSLVERVVCGFTPGRSAGRMVALSEQQNRASAMDMPSLGNPYTPPCFRENHSGSSCCCQGLSFCRRRPRPIALGVAASRPGLRTRAAGGTLQFVGPSWGRRDRRGHRRAHDGRRTFNADACSCAVPVLSHRPAGIRCRHVARPPLRQRPHRIEPRASPDASRARVGLQGRPRAETCLEGTALGSAARGFRLCPSRDHRRRHGVLRLVSRPQGLRARPCHRRAALERLHRGPGPVRTGCRTCRWADCRRETPLRGLR